MAQAAAEAGTAPAKTKAQIEAEAKQLLAQTSLIAFIEIVAPWFIIEEVHVAIAHYLQKVATGEIDRLMVFMAPRTGKSLMASVFFPAWMMGRFPSDKVLTASYQVEMAEGFGSQIRDIVNSREFRAVFPGTALSKSTTAKGYFQIVPPGGGQKGEFRAIGTTSGAAGKGWNLGIIDDPLSEQDARSDLAKKKVWEWYPPGFYTRRQPERNRLVLMSTRWAKDDLPGMLLELAKNDKKADKWVVLSVPAILDGAAAKVMNTCAKTGALDIPGGPRVLKAGQSFSPRRWTLAELHRSKNNMPPKYWTALYLQKPVEDEGHILKRKFWRKWPKEDPPPCEFVIQCWDTAFEEEEENDFSARTTWGIFEHVATTERRERVIKGGERVITGGHEQAMYSAILLERWKKRVQAKDLLALALDAYQTYNPDRVLIEKRASGIQLVQELRRYKVPVSPWLPPGGGRYSKSKVPRAHAASIPLEMGAVWYMDRDWADDVISESADFPYGEHDDLTDTVTMALIFLRRTFWLQLPSDEEQIEDHAPQTRTEPGRRELYG